MASLFNRKVQSVCSKEFSLARIELYGSTKTLRRRIQRELRLRFLFVAYASTLHQKRSKSSISVSFVLLQKHTTNKSCMCHGREQIHPQSFESREWTLPGWLSSRYGCSSLITSGRYDRFGVALNQAIKSSTHVIWLITFNWSWTGICKSISCRTKYAKKSF